MANAMSQILGRPYASLGFEAENKVFTLVKNAGKISMK